MLLWAGCLAQLPRKLLSYGQIPAYVKRCRQLQAAYPCASAPCTSHQPNWDCRSNLVKNGCCYCVTGCAFGFTVSWEHTWAGAGETMGREFWISWRVSAYFWHLKDDSPQHFSSASLLAHLGFPPISSLASP